jgi:hypothetical protein
MQRMTTLRSHLVRTYPEDRSRYGLSDRGFGKPCGRYKIPVPPRGWWAKHAAGKRVKQQALPPLNDPYCQKIRFETRPRETTTDEAPPEVHPLIAFEQDVANRISVPAEGKLAHPLVLKTERLLKRAKRDAGGLIASPTGALQVHTSRALHG